MGAKEVHQDVAWIKHMEWLEELRDLVEIYKIMIFINLVDSLYPRVEMSSTTENGFKVRGGKFKGFYEAFFC